MWSSTDADLVLDGPHLYIPFCSGLTLFSFSVAKYIFLVIGCPPSSSSTKKGLGSSTYENPDEVESLFSSSEKKIEFDFWRISASDVLPLGEIGSSTTLTWSDISSEYSGKSLSSPWYLEYDELFQCYLQVTFGFFIAQQGKIPMNWWIKDGFDQKIVIKCNFTFRFSWKFYYQWCNLDYLCIVKKQSKGYKVNFLSLKIISLN